MDKEEGDEGGRGIDWVDGRGMEREGEGGRGMWRRDNEERDKGQGRER